MRIGLGLETNGTVEDVVARAKRLAESGAVALWSSQIFGHDTLTALAVVGREVPGVELGTAVIPVQPRHPQMLAAQALTVQSASGNRLTLGVGLSHQMVVENIWGMSFEKPLRYIREYLSILMPLLHGEQAAFVGEVLRTTTMGPLDHVGLSEAPPVLVAALGPAMLRLAGTVTQGTVTWMTGPSTLESHIVPTITAAASEAGRPAPRIAASLPVCVTADPDAARERAAKVFAVYGHLPSYRAMLDREGAGGPADLAIAGDESVVTAGVRRAESAGVTDFIGTVFGSRAEIERTQALLGEMAKS